MTFGQVADAVKEAFTTYLGYTPPTFRSPLRADDQFGKFAVIEPSALAIDDRVTGIVPRKHHPLGNERNPCPWRRTAAIAQNYV